MKTTQISHARQSQMAIAFRAGREAARTSKKEFNFQVPNKFAVDGMMPESLATVAGSLYHAFGAGIDREMSSVANAATMMRNARFLMRRATELGRA